MKKQIGCVSLLQHQLLSILSESLFERNSVYSPECIEDILNEANKQAVLPLVFSAVYPLGDTKWKNKNSQVVARNIQITYEHAEVAELLNGIPYTILKGSAAAAYYPNPILRTMGDVDFLVYERDFEQVAMLLRAAGFAQKADLDGKHVAFQRANSIWEMHRYVNGIPDGDTGVLVRSWCSEIIETAMDYDIGEGTIKVPDLFHHGLILLLHTASHLTSEGIGLRHLCDWAVFVSKLSNDEFIDVFKEKLSKCGLWRFAQLITLCGVKYLGCPEREWAGTESDKVLENIILDILQSGNFGCKDTDRFRQIKYIANRGQHTVDEKGVIHQLLDTIKKKAIAENKSQQQIVWEYFLLLLSGDRKVDHRRTLLQAQKRKDIYKEFHLFDPDWRR